jgi:adenine-specific DNA-methyltransferase
MLDKIHDEMKPDENLLIMCKSYQSQCDNKFSNISVKKIPQMLLGKCEFGKEDYSLNIINMPVDEEFTNIDYIEPTIISDEDELRPVKAKKPKDDMPKLF